MVSIYGCLLKYNRNCEYMCLKDPCVGTESSSNTYICACVNDKIYIYVRSYESTLWYSVVDKCSQMHCNVFDCRYCRDILE